MVRPAVPCEGDDEDTAPYLNNNYVSKIEKEPDAAENEFKAIQRRSKLALDPTGRFTISGVRMCKLKPTNETRSLLSRCGIPDWSLDAALASSNQLVMPYGGDTLKAALNKLSKEDPVLFAEKLPQFLHALADLATWMAALHASGSAHFDVKNENILYDDATRAMRVIDFGDEIDVVSQAEDAHLYAMHPYEWRLISYLRLDFNWFRGGTLLTPSELDAVLSGPVFQSRVTQMLKDAMAVNFSGMYFEQPRVNLGGYLEPHHGTAPFRPEDLLQALGTLAHVFRDAIAAYMAKNGPVAAADLSWSKVVEFQRWLMAHELALKQSADVFGFGSLLLQVVGVRPMKALRTVFTPEQIADVKALIADATKPAALTRLPMAEFASRLHGIVDGLGAGAGAGVGAGAGGPGATVYGGRRVRRQGRDRD